MTTLRSLICLAYRLFFHKPHKNISSFFNAENKPFGSIFIRHRKSNIIQGLDLGHHPPRVDISVATPLHHLKKHPNGCFFHSCSLKPPCVAGPHRKSNIIQGLDLGHHPPRVDIIVAKPLHHLKSTQTGAFLQPFLRILYSNLS